MEKADLSAELSICNCDQAEIEHVITRHFGSAQALDKDTIVFPGDQTNYALRLTYRKGRLQHVNGGPGLTKLDLQTLRKRIAADVLAELKPKVTHYALFSPVPVVGAYRYGSVFQILPVPDEAPKTNEAMGAHPFLLEFRFRDSADMSIKNIRKETRRRELELFLACVLRFRVYGHGSALQKYWVLPVVDGKRGPEEWTSVYAQEMYTWPKAHSETDEFSSIDSVQPLNTVEPGKYYGRLGIALGDALELPAKMDDLVQTFLELAEDDREQFLRACFWFQFASRTFLQSQSAMILALVSAVEALIPVPADERFCPQCGKKETAGPTQLFNKFVDEYTAGSVAKKDLKKFYRLRSQITHGGRLLSSDLFSWRGGITPGDIHEYADKQALQHVVQIVLINWLLSRRGQSSVSES